jgi:integrase
VTAPLLLFGFIGALRRSELVSLRVEDVAVVAGGLRLRILRGKTDQAGQGAKTGLPRRRPSRPVRCALSRLGRRWREEKPGRCFERSAPGMGSATPRCIRTRNQAESRRIKLYFSAYGGSPSPLLDGSVIATALLRGARLY